MTCTHRAIRSWSEIDGSPVPMWTCVDCGAHFDPREDNTAPPPRKPLTDAEIGKILERGDVAERDAENGWWHVLPYSFARAIEAAHGIKGQE
jgi:hypothetical protein